MDEFRGRKRLLVGDDGDEPPLKQRKPIFPKGKKQKVEDHRSFAVEYDVGGNDLIETDLAAKERAKRRIEKREKDLFGNTADISVSEILYEDDSNFEIDGVEMEPFNLKQEREEGYFDENGNYVEYKHEEEIKDAWLDSISVDLKFVETIKGRKISEEEYEEDLSIDDIRVIKKRIINNLQPGETIIHALKRLKGNASDKRAKMSESTKLTFDQLTEDAMKLMENGEYNVYHEDRETFERELARKEEDKYDMFGEEEDHGNRNIHSDEVTLESTSASGQTPTSATDSQQASQNYDFTKDETGGIESDYVYDTSSGYYYSAALDYYYDPISKLYCCAVSGLWYSFDEQLGTYVQVDGASSDI